MALADHHRAVHDLGDLVLPVLKPLDKPFKPRHVPLKKVDVTRVKGLLHLDDEQLAVEVRGAWRTMVPPACQAVGRIARSAASRSASALSLTR